MCYLETVKCNYMKRSIKHVIIFSIYILICFYGINRLAHHFLPKWIDMLVGLPLSFYLIYVGIIHYVKSIDNEHNKTNI